MPYLVTPVVPPGRMRELEQPVLRAAGGLLLRPWEAGDAGVVLGRVAAKAGFAPEGTLRGAMLHPDGWHDMHLHGRVRGDA